jgi:hypothetical protein
MPLFRYFLFTGATLLGLLVLLDWYLPAAALTEAHSEIDRSVIRIHSRHKWPEAIRMDTSAPLVTAAAPIAVAVEASAPHAPPARPAQPEKPARPGKLAQADEPQAALRKSPERASQQARPTRQARRDSRLRPAMREAGQRIASYRTPDWFGWPSAGW